MSANTAPSFTLPNANGKIIVDFGASSDRARGISVQADGKILLAGTTFSDQDLSSEFAILRYNQDGSLDTSFAKNGQLHIDFGDLDIALYAFTMQSDGKFLATGQALDSSGKSSIVLVRFDAQGNLDQRFGVRGKVMSGFEDSSLAGRSIVVQSDGKILIGGFESSGTADDYTSNFFAIRYLPNGIIDHSFLGSGYVSISPADFYFDISQVDTILKYPDGKILLAGYSELSHGISLVRLNSNGSVDHSFAVNGIYSGDVFPENSEMRGVALDTDGNIIVTSFSTKTGVDVKENRNFLLARILKNGSFDYAFGPAGSNGLVYTDFGANESPGTVFIQADGKIVIAGWQTNHGDNSFAIARYFNDGRLDYEFGSDGKVLVKLGAQTSNQDGSSADAVFKITQQADGKLLFAGHSFNGHDLDFGMLRLNQDGTVDQDFGSAGWNNTLDVKTIYNQGYPALAIDNKVHIVDAELAALNQGKGNYEGASLHLQRQGKAELSDQFSAVGELKFTDGHAYLSGLEIASVSSKDGTLELLFNANATQQVVDNVLQSLAFRSDHPASSGEIKMEWRFSDGNTGVQGVGGSLNVTGVSTIQSPVKSVPYPYWIDAIIPSGMASINQNLLGTNKTFYYDFLSQVPSYGSSYDETTFAALTTEQRNFIKSALDYIASVLDLKFVETFNPAQLNTLAFASYDTGTAAASAHYPSTNFIGSDINLLAGDSKTLHPAEGKYFAYTLMHELGHALGLQHTFEARESGQILSAGEDNSINSVMSYTTDPASYYLKYSPLDIAALQYLYGVAPTARAGNDVYQLSTTSTNFIWDGAGNDTISAEGIDQPVTLHLSPGYWDYIGSRSEVISNPGQITVNYGSAIENLTGGNGADQLFGSDGNNQISGGAGNDVLDAGAGDDLIDGGTGTDVSVYHGKLANYKLTHDASGYHVTDKSLLDGSDTLRNVEQLQFSDVHLNLTVQAAAAALPASDVAHLIELYVAFFNRTPDADGLQYWIGQMAQGQNLSSLALSFYQAGMALSGDAGNGKVASVESATAFVQGVYKTVLGRVNGADQAGLNYWVNGILEGRETPASTVKTILDVAHGFKGNAEWGWVADLLDNKIAVSKTIAIDWGIAYNTAEQAIAHGVDIAAAITPLDQSKALSLIGIAPSEISLV